MKSLALFFFINTLKCFSLQFSGTPLLHIRNTATETNTDISDNQLTSATLFSCGPSSHTISPSSSSDGNNIHQDRCVQRPHLTSPTTRNKIISRRNILSYVAITATVISALPLTIPNANAYEPDSDPLRESLYLLSRVQEATVQQERLVKNAKIQEDLQKKMKLSLRLVERSYRVVDQITYCSKFIAGDDIVDATAAGLEAANALQEAIDYVATGLGSGPITEKQRNFLTEALVTTRQELFNFLKYVPSDKLKEARLRVEKENVDNREEFDGDANAGVYNPVVLPWKSQQ